MQPTATIPVIKQLMMEKGALSISYCHDSSYYNEETASHYADTFHFSNHEVLLVGWDDNYPRENFRVECRPENDGAWLVRNSWGTDWGDAGYFWLSYEDKSIEYGSYYQLEENDNYAHNYQYDTLGWSVSVAADEFINPDKATMAGYLSNIFTAESDEQLEAVSFYTTDAGTEYEISVWAGVSEDDPTSGRLVYSGQSGRELYAGYHTVELDRAVRLQAGERFSVVVYLKNNTYPYPIAAECCFMPYSQSAPQATGSGGESYYSLDGEHWSDVINLEYQFSDVHATITNVCLKAFTNPLPDDGEASANVRFSLLQGPIALGSELALSGAEEICYQIDGGEITRYTAPIVLERACTVTAWSVTNGKKGNAVTRSYTQARSTLTELMIRQGDSTLNCDLSDGTDNYTLYVNRQTDRINVLARGCDTITVNANTTVTAIWENIPVTYYTVTFDSNGGSAVTAQSIEAGQKATKPADPTKDGYDFKGWTLNGSAYDFNTAVNGNITLVATWEQQQVVPTTYTVSFAANGGTGTMADVTGISGEYTLPENGFTAPDGKQFKAWSVGGVEKAVGDKITVTANTTVTAVWETIPAGHTCDIKPIAKVEPSCTEGGKEAYYKCEGCGKFYEDALGTKEITDLASWGNLAKLGHTESDWKSDKDNHWKECTVAGCGVIIENSKAAHADANNDGKCDTCEYNVGIPTTPGGDKPNDNPQTSDNSMMWLWIALLFVSGFGVVTTTVYTKKRKSVK